MKRLSSDEIGFYGKPIDQLNRRELIEAIIELASIVNECVSKNKKCEEILRIKKDSEKIK